MEMEATQGQEGEVTHLHEELCPSHYKSIISRNDCTYCELIVKVRAYYTNNPADNRP